MTTIAIDDEFRFDFKSKLNASLTHFQTGLAYMLPFLMLGALGRVIPALFGVSFVDQPDNPLLAAILAAGNEGFNLFVPILCAFIAYAIADKPAIAPGMIVGVIAASGGSGYLGGLLGGFLAGYATYVIMGLDRKVPEALRATYDSFMPALGGIAVAVVVYLFVNPPVAALMTAVTTWLGTMSAANGPALGLLLGVIPGIDFGGPLSQAKFLFALGASAEGINMPLAMTLTSSVPAIGMCLATWMAPRLYDEELRAYGRTSIIYSIIGGWTEITIPFAVNDWWRVTVASIVGAGVSGVIAGSIGLTLSVPVLGIIGSPLYNYWWGWIVAITPGALVTALLANLLKSIARRRQPTAPVEEAEPAGTPNGGGDQR